MKDTIGYANVITADDIDRYADYEPCKDSYIVKKNPNLIDRKVIEDIKAEIQYEADNKAVPRDMMGYYRCLQIIDEHCGKEKE